MLQSTSQLLFRTEDLSPPADGTQAFTVSSSKYRLVSKEMLHPRPCTLSCPSPPGSGFLRGAKTLTPNPEQLWGPLSGQLRPFIKTVSQPDFFLCPTLLLFLPFHGWESASQGRNQSICWQPPLEQTASKSHSSENCHSLSLGYYFATDLLPVVTHRFFLKSTLTSTV